MDVEQCYRMFGGDYEGTLSRLAKPELVKRLLKKFIADTSIEALDASIAEGDCEGAFRAAHTLKGVALNMGFSELAKSSSELTEHLRNGSIEGCGALRDAAARDYRRVKDALSLLN